MLNADRSWFLTVIISLPWAALDAGVDLLGDLRVDVRLRHAFLQYQNDCLNDKRNIGGSSN
jgi:hypothetical protein